MAGNKRGVVCRRCSRVQAFGFWEIDNFSHLYSTVLMGNNTTCRVLKFRQYTDINVFSYYLDLTRFGVLLKKKALQANQLANCLQCWCDQTFTFLIDRKGDNKISGLEEEIRLIWPFITMPHHCFFAKSQTLPNFHSLSLPTLISNECVPVVLSVGSAGSVSGC